MPELLGSAATISESPAQIMVFHITARDIIIAIELKVAGELTSIVPIHIGQMT